MASPCGSGQHPVVLLAVFLSDSELILWQAHGHNSKHAWNLATAHISVGPPVSTHGSRVRSHLSSAQGPNPATAASSLLLTYAQVSTPQLLSGCAHLLVPLPLEPPKIGSFLLFKVSPNITSPEAVLLVTHLP